MKPEEKTTVRHASLRHRLFTFFLIFVILIFAVLWFFQIRMLGFFYHRERFREMNDMADKLSGHVADEDLEELVETFSQKGSACIRVFEIRDDVAMPIADAEVRGHCAIHRIAPSRLSELYNKALQEGGTYNQRIAVGEAGNEQEEGFQVPGSHKQSDSVSAVHVRILSVDGIEYFLMVNCELSPVDTTVRTLQVQFFWIAGILAIAASLSIVILSRVISRPLVAITQKARGLAQGNYEPDFSGNGYKEVQELAEALNYAATEIGATDRLRKELIANISHDLRTPLTMIKGYSEMMRDIPGENSPENVQVIIDETTRLSELVGDLMDLSKLQSGAKKPDKTVFDLTEIVQVTLQRYDTLIRHEGYRIEVHAEEQAYVCADRTMILQVIYNLINNAVNYTGESKRVVVSQTLRENCVRLAVSDDGEGIPPDKISEIWDRYYRVDKVHKRAVMGTGLGLSIVKSVLEAHGANYGVDSAVGIGSVFWFELPLTEPPRQDGN